MTPPDDVHKRLQEIRERVEAATEGPWKLWNGWGPSERDGKHRVSKIGPSAYHKNSIHADGADIVGRAGDLEFLTAARSDVPYLLSLVEDVLEGRDQIHTQVAGVVNAMKATLDEPPETESVSEETVRRWMKHLSAAPRDAAQEGADDG